MISTETTRIVEKPLFGGTSLWLKWHKTKSIVKSKNAFCRSREDTSWNKIGKLSQSLTTFGDMQNGWKKSFAPQKMRIPRQLRTTHAGWSLWSSRTIMPNFTGIKEIGSVCVHTCRRDSDRSMVGPRQIASQRSARMLEFAWTRSVFQARSAADRFHPFGVRRALVPSLKGRKATVWVSKSSSKISQAPSFYLRRRVFARETLRSSWVLTGGVAGRWGLSRPVGVRFGRLGWYGHHPLSTSSWERG